jgi:predicted SAM-dependent methyltransferase
LGCGANVIAGWTNVDIDAQPPIVSWDLTRPIPLPDASIDFIFNEHFIEHMTRVEALALLVDCHRLLRLGGVLRVSTPDLKKLVEEYSASRTSEWLDVNWSPQSPCQMMNEGMRSWGHKFLYDESEFDSVLREAGFNDVQRVGWRQSSIEALAGRECRPFHGELIFEAEKRRRD